MAKKQTSSDSKPEFIGAEFLEWQDKVTAMQEIANEGIDLIEGTFVKRDNQIKLITSLRTPCALAIEQGDKAKLDEAMGKIADAHKTIAEAQQHAKDGVVQLDTALEKINKLSKEAQIWRGRSELRLSDAHEFRRMVAGINVSFSVLTGRLQFLKTKVAELRPPATETGPVRCPRCHMSDTVALLTADAHEKVYSCSTNICPNFTVALHIASPEPVPA